MMRRQAGYTMIELLVVTAIMGVVIVGMGMTVTNVMKNADQPTGQSVLLIQVQNTGRWVSRDIQMSNNVTLTEPTGFPASLKIPVDGDRNNDYTVEYEIVDSELKRNQYDALGVFDHGTIVARGVNTDNTTIEMIDDNYYWITVGVAVSDDTLIRSYGVRQRIVSQ
jgi:prepilin-type N-terminal cleavage/methylation domain-containing protein